MRTQLGIPITLGSGLALLQDADVDLAALLRRADAALYAVKQAGRDRLHISDGI